MRKMWRTVKAVFHISAFWKIRKKKKKTSLNISNHCHDRICPSLYLKLGNWTWCCLYSSDFVYSDHENCGERACSYFGVRGWQALEGLTSFSLPWGCRWCSWDGAQAIFLSISFLFRYVFPRPKSLNIEQIRPSVSDHRMLQFQKRN